MPSLSEPQRLELLRLLEEKPQLNQRELARALGVSLGKVNYCLKALIEKGFVKLGNFRDNPNKRQYSYLLAPAGLKEKTRITMAFLRVKVAEYATLEKEIERLKNDLNKYETNTAGSVERVTR